MATVPSGHFFCKTLSGVEVRQPKKHANLREII
jgi:hypothetical protein